jgi:hypothetical protein
MLLRAVILCLVATPAFAQVHSLTLGLDVNSPYGLSEPWFTIRNALLRSDDFERVAERPDVKTATAEAIPKGGQIPDLTKLQKVVSESGAGATLRSVEAAVEGEMISKENRWMLRVDDKQILLRPLTELVQQDRKKAKPPTAEELTAYQRLAEHANAGKRVRVTGPLRFKSSLALEVRTFESGKPNNSKGKL